MLGRLIVTGSLLALVGMGAASTALADSEGAKLRKELEQISHKRILFGHQSVGENLLDGVKQLSTTAGVPLNIVEVKTADAVQPSSFGHVVVAENRLPLKKLRSFEQAMGSRPSKIDVALVKLCYIDFNSKTDVNDIFNSYRTSIEQLRTKHPGTTFVHVTAPLTVVEDGIKIRVKKLLGKAPPETIENLRRDQYNALLRQTYLGKEPVFDLARVESTTANGSSRTVTWEGRSIPMLIPEYSDDGGHLNAEGKQRAARELISVLASVPDKPAAR